MPLYHEDNQQVDFLKKCVLKIIRIASMVELTWVHDHLLSILLPKHYNPSKLVNNVDLVHPLLFAKAAIVPVAFVANGEISYEYYSIGCDNKPIPIFLTWQYSPTLCSDCLRLNSYTNDNMQLQYGQISIIGLEALGVQCKINHYCRGF